MLSGIAPAQELSPRQPAFAVTQLLLGSLQSKHTLREEPCGSCLRSPWSQPFVPVRLEAKAQLATCRLLAGCTSPHALPIQHRSWGTTSKTKNMPGEAIGRVLIKKALMKYWGQSGVTCSHSMPPFPLLRDRRPQTHQVKMFASSFPKLEVEI